LSFATVHGQLYGMTISTAESFIAMKQALNPVFSRRDTSQISDGIPQCCSVDNCGLTRLKRRDINPQNLLRGEIFADLQSRFFGVVSRQKQEQTAIQCFVGEVLGKAQRKAKPGRTCVSGLKLNRYRQQDDKSK